MLSVAEAQAIVLQHAQPLPAAKTPLTVSALGLVLAENVPSDLDVPPFDKAVMDGYAIHSADLLSGQGILRVIEEVTAGKTPQLAVERGQATRIMTGAPMPSGADAVVIIEKTKLLSDGRVEISDQPPRPRQNVIPRAAEMRAGEAVLQAGSILRPQEFGLLAMVGRTQVLAHPRPEVAIVATGDELAEPAQIPDPGQIRNSNGPMLAGQVHRAGGLPRMLPIAPDREDRLRELIADGLKSSVLVLSGGVSAGKLDLVPGVLEQLGVRPHFHKISMKPGKPVFFGTRGATLVFGLPGNPVSSLVCFELFVRPAVRRLMGMNDPGPCMQSAVLASDFAYQSDRPTYYPAHVELCDAGWKASLLPWSGSSDLRGLARANAFVLLPVGNHQHRSGQRFPVLFVES
jgi:molybdopterin molybdotransferase